LFAFHAAPSVVAAIIAYWRILLIPEMRVENTTRDISGVQD